MTVHLNLLGPFELLVDGRNVAATRGRVRLLLSLLIAADGDWMSTDRLEDEIWRDTPPASPKTALQITVSRTRSLLGDDSRSLLQSGPAGYRIDTDACTSDIGKWFMIGGRPGGRPSGSGEPAAATIDPQAALQLLELWRGRPFADLDHDSALLSATSTHLAEHRVRLAVAATGPTTRSSQAIAALRAIEQDDPFREEVVVALMQAYQRAGRIIEALALGRRFRGGLRDEFGLSPSAEFDRSEAVLLASNDTEPRPPIAAKPDQQTPESPARTRWREDLLLEAATEITEDTAVLVEAPAGYGAQRFVTDLVAELAARDIKPPDITIVRPTIDLRDDESTTIEVGDSVTIRLGAFDRDDVHKLCRSVSRADIGETDERVEVALLDAVDLLWSWYRGDPEATVQGAQVLVGAESDFRESGLVQTLPIAEADRTAWAQAARGLDPSDRALATACALSGPTIDVGLVATVASRTVSDVLGLIDRMPAALIRRDGSGWHLRSESARNAIAGESGALDAARIHLSVLETLQGLGRAAVDLAPHALDAHPVVAEDTIVDLLTACGTQLGGAGQATRVRRLAERGLRLPLAGVARARLELLLAKATEIEGHLLLADARYDEAMMTAASNDPPDLGLVCDIAIDGMGHRGDIGGSTGRRRRLELARRLVSPDHPQADLVMVEMAGEQMNAGHRPDPAVERQLLRLARGPVNDAQLLGRRLVVALADLDDAPNLVDARSLATDLESTPAATQQRLAERCLIVAIHVAAQHGELVSAQAWLTEMEFYGQRFGQPRARWRPLVARSALYEAQGLPDEADVVATEALELGRELGMTDALPSYLAHHLVRAFRNGSLAVLATSLDDASQRLDNPMLEAFRGLAQLDAGNETRARSHLLEFRTMIRPAVDPFRVAGFAAGCLLSARLADADSARFCFRSLEARTGLLAFVGYCGPFVGPVDWFLSIAAETVGERARARSLANSSIELCKRAGLVRWKPPPLS